MSDFTLKPCSTVITGMTGTGKTTLAFLHLLKTPCACRFIFDDMGQAAARLKLPHVSTPKQLEASLQTRWSCFNPHPMFRGDVNAAHEFWCKWVFETSRRTRHKKIAFTDEAWRFQDRENISQEMSVLSQMGRSENIEQLTTTLEPHRMNSALLGSATELICFRLQDSIDLKKIQGLGADADAVSRLPLGSFISYNRVNPTRPDGTKNIYRGKLF
ncbi:MAG: hypothetical protein PHY43_03930 [Verrucomicrobiales bacterium]|nr:hypothetical protein [Verrucomicrobiales bacterium]